MSQPREPLTPAEILAQTWLERQKCDNREPMLDAGDCRLCGRPADEGHEPTDPCGIVAGLLAVIAGAAALHREAEDNDAQSRTLNPSGISGPDQAATTTATGTTLQETQSFAWLIERYSGSALVYWSGRRKGGEEFSSEWNWAVRFARFEDAEQVRGHVIEHGECCRSVMHGFTEITPQKVGNATTPTQEPAAASDRSAAPRDSIDSSSLPREAGPGLTVEEAKRDLLDSMDGLKYRPESKRKLVDALIAAVRASAPEARLIALQAPQEDTETLLRARPPERVSESDQAAAKIERVYRCPTCGAEESAWR